VVGVVVVLTSTATPLAILALTNSRALRYDVAVMGTCSVWPTRVMLLSATFGMLVKAAEKLLVYLAVV
jgi:hypothetical protein